MRVLRAGNAGAVQKRYANSAGINPASGKRRKRNRMHKRFLLSWEVMCDKIRKHNGNKLFLRRFTTVENFPLWMLPNLSRHDPI